MATAYSKLTAILNGLHDEALQKNTQNQNKHI